MFEIAMLGTRLFKIIKKGKKNKIDSCVYLWVVKHDYCQDEAV